MRKQIIHQDTEDDTIIRDQMVNLSCLLVCTCDKILSPVLVAAQTINNLDLGNESEGYKSD